MNVVVLDISFEITLYTDIEGGNKKKKKKYFGKQIQNEILVGLNTLISDSVLEKAF
jgi:hypothetical protein